MRAPITLDLHITNFNYPDVPPEGLFDHSSEIATTAEDNGFSSVSFMDHLHQIPPMGPQEHNMLEGNTVLAGIAARTQKVDVGLLVGGVTYRNPALLAKMTTTLDIISGGRAIFGIGAAWFEAEHQAFGVRFPPLKERFEHLEDALRIARAMFTRGAGRRSRARTTASTARSTTRSRSAATSRSSSAAAASARRCAWSRSTPTAATCSATSSASSTCSACSRATARTSGRDPAEITKTRMAGVIIAGTHEAAQKKKEAAAAAGVPRDRLESMLVGDPDTIAEAAAAYKAVGIQGLTVTLPDMWDLETIALTGKTLGAVFG